MKKIEFPKLNREVAIIHWEDSYNHGSFYRSEKEWKVYGLVNAITVGMILDEDQRKINIATDYFYPQPPAEKEGAFRNVVSIPKVNILSIVRYLLSSFYNQGKPVKIEQKKL